MWFRSWIGSRIKQWVFVNGWYHNWRLFGEVVLVVSITSDISVSAHNKRSVNTRSVASARIVCRQHHRDCWDKSGCDGVGRAADQEKTRTHHLGIPWSYLGLGKSKVEQIFSNWTFHWWRDNQLWCITADIGVCWELDGIISGGLFLCAFLDVWRWGRACCQPGKYWNCRQWYLLYQK